MLAVMDIKFNDIKTFMLENFYAAIIISGTVVSCDIKMRMLLEIPFTVAYVDLVYTYTCICILFLYCEFVFVLFYISIYTE